VKRRTLQHSRATALLPDEATPGLAAAMPTTPDMRTACSAVTPSAGFGNCEPAHRTVGYRPSGDAGASTRWDGTARLDGQRASSLSRNGRMTHNAQLGGLRLREFPDRSLARGFGLRPKADLVHSTRVITSAFALLKTQLICHRSCHADGLHFSGAGSSACDATSVG
jgi:hypothetical protein